MTLRDAVVADARAIATVHVETWRAAYSHVLPASFLASIDIARREQIWAEAISGGDEVLVAEVDGAVVGFVALGPAADEPEGVGEVLAIYVLPDAWGTGAGRELMIAAVARLSAQGFGEAMLWVLEDNPRARRFYEAGGWSTDGGQKTDAIGGTEISEVRYRLALRGHVPGTRP